jgi:hypothetical protein
MLDRRAQILLKTLVGATSPRKPVGRALSRYPVWI